MKLTRVWLAAAILAVAAMPGVAQTPSPEIVVQVGGTAMIPAPGFQKSVVIDADKADFEVLPDGVRVRGKALGQTKVVVWDRDGKTHPYLVTVVASGEVDRQRERTIKAALAADALTRDLAIEVTVDGDTATLSGTVSSGAAAERATALAGARIAKVQNKLTIGPAPALGPAVAPRSAPETGAVPPPALPSGSRTNPPLANLPSLGVKLDDIKQAGALDMSVGEARLVTVPTELKRALIAESAVADVVMMPPREVVIIAKAPGETTLMLWYIGADAYLGQRESAMVKVRVVGPPEKAGAPGNTPSAAEIDRVLALVGVQGVQVVTRHDATAPSVILTGTVPTQAHRLRAEQAITALFPTTSRISNFIEVRSLASQRPEVLEAQANRIEKLLAAELPNASIRVRLRTEPDGETLRVLLSGEAPVPADRLKAEQIVQFELGSAAQITNNIVTPLPPPPDELVGGGAGGPAPGGAAGGGKPVAAAERKPIAQAVAEALEASGVPHERVVVEVFETPKKRVVLRGSCRNEEEQADIVQAVQEVVEQYNNEYELRDKGLQVKMARVVTEAQIVEMTASDLRQIGFSYGTPTGGTGTSGGTGSTTSGTSVVSSNGQLTVYGERTANGRINRLDALAASVRALVTNNRARVLSQPNITSNESQQGTVEIVTEIPLPSTTTGTGGTTGVSVEFRPVGIRLLVTPRIAWAPTTNAIEMTIETEVSAVDYGLSVVIGNSTIPALTTRKAITVVTVDDGETLAIGGLTTETERKNVSRLPFISDIPVIGELFRNTENRKEQTTVVVVMTPRIKW